MHAEQVMLIKGAEDAYACAMSINILLRLHVTQSCACALDKLLCIVVSWYPSQRGLGRRGCFKQTVNMKCRAAGPVPAPGLLTGVSARPGVCCALWGHNSPECTRLVHTPSPQRRDYCLWQGPLPRSFRKAGKTAGKATPTLQPKEGTNGISCGLFACVRICNHAAHTQTQSHAQETHAV